LSLSVGILAFNSAAYIETLLQAAKQFADELVIGVDSSSTDSTERICRLYADKLFRLEPIGTSERALAWLNEQCTGDWIFRLDHDELPSTGLIKALPRLLADREYTHYWLPRRWIIGAEQVRWISQSPWWPDWQLRLFRNLPSLVSFPGHLHSDYVVQGAAGRFAEGSIYHFNLVYLSEERRRERMDRYEYISPYNSMPHFYLPREAELETRLIPDEDKPWRARSDFHPHSDTCGTASTSPAYVSRAEMSQAERRECSYPSELFRATLECLYFPAGLEAGKVCPAELRLRNDSAFTWRSSGLGVPDVRVSYHLFDSSGELYEFEGIRTDLPLSVRPGESIKVIAQVASPWESGGYIVRWDLIIENVSWFSSRGWTGPEVQAKCTYSYIRSQTIGKLGRYLKMSHGILGWTRLEEAEALASLSYSLRDDAVIVEVGSFLGAGTILLAGPRELRRSGKVHCVDPFDCSGDSFSAPQYRQILARLGGGSLRERFDENIRLAGLTQRVEVHRGTAGEVAANWNTPIDLLVLDGDHSRRGARLAYESWVPYLKPGGTIAVHNSNDRVYAEDHDGSRRLVVEEILPPQYTDISLIGTTTFARKVGVSPPVTCSAAVMRDGESISTSEPDHLP